MAYDALGNYVPDDEPSLAQMRVALSQNQSPAVSQIPGYDKPVPKPTPARPLDNVPAAFKQIANNYNPLMLQLMMRDAGKIGANMVSPFVGAYAGALGNVQAKGAELMYGAMGDEASAQEARGRMVRPDAPEQAAKFYQQPQTPVMRNFEEDLGSVFGAMHLPAAGPGSGMPGSGPISPRPLVTPNDVRVMGAEATRVGRQIRDIPTDFGNAQSGFQRLDPLTNEPTYGAKLQGVAQDIGDITAGRTAAGKSLIPGVPDILMPETSLYAVRPKGSRLMSPTRTSSDPNFQYSRDPAGAILRNEFARPYSTEIAPSELLGIAENFKTNRERDPQTERAFDNYFTSRVQQMFPDAPDGYQAQEAFRNKYADPESKARMELVILNDFLTQTPEGQASGMPVPMELEKRHLAAMKWLTGPFTNYIERNVGTEGDPLVKLASEGLTMLPPEEINDTQRSRYSEAEKYRVQGGYPIGGSFEKLLALKARDLQNARQELRSLETQRNELATAARAQGLTDPAQLPDYAALTNPIRAKAAARDKLQKEYENMELGAMYEDVTDSAVIPRPAAAAKATLDYPQKQFYPTLYQTPDDALVYQAQPTTLRAAGFDKIANKFYDDVMSGKIPLNKVEKTTVENFVRGKSQERIKLESEKKVKDAQYIAKAEDNLRAVLQRDVPNSMTFGNAGVIELNTNTPQDIAVARVSEDTAVLDHCVGEGCSASGNKINIFTGKQQRYEPIIDLITGQPNPNASKQMTAYVRDLYSGSQLASIRSLETGRPVATLQFEKSHIGSDGQQTYRIGYASGFQNGPVDPAYAPAIRDYLNSRADNIRGTGSNLVDNTGVYDITEPNNVSALARKTRIDRAQLANVLDSLPRFVLPEDVTKAFNDASDTQLAVPATTAAPVMRPDDTTVLRESMDTALGNAIDFVDTERLGDALSGVVRGRISEFLEGVRAEDLHDALLNFREALRGDEATFVNGFSEFNNALGEGLGEYLNDLDGIIDFNERRAREREAPVAAPVDPLANLFDDLEPEPNHPANLPAPVLAPAVDFPGILDRVMFNLSQTEGVDIAERVETVAARVAENVTPRLDPVSYAAAVREAADREQSETVELALYDLADQIETAAGRALQAPAPAEQPANMADRFPIPTDVRNASTPVLANRLTPADEGDVTALFDTLTSVNDRQDLPRIVHLIRNHRIGEWEEFDDVQREILARLVDEHYENAPPGEPPPRRGPFRPGGASAVRGVPLGNLNIQPSIRAEALRGPDTQPVSNFLQQVRGLPGVTQEGLTTGLMAFEQMDPSRRITKAEFVRELLPSSYDIVDLAGAATDNVHIRDLAEEELGDDITPVAKALGFTKASQIDTWATARYHYDDDFDAFPASAKKILRKLGIEDAAGYAEAYDTAYEKAIQAFVDDYMEYNDIANGDYRYSSDQRLVEPDMGDQYAEFGVSHPDQRGTYHHYPEAPDGVMGHFRGTYNHADPISLKTYKLNPNGKGDWTGQYFATEPNSYVIEEIQSDAQKSAQQVKHLHQVHGLMFKAAIQKGLELGADTIYLPTALSIAGERGSKPTQFTPIYDQAIVKEGLKPLLKIPGVTSKMVNGYHEISFTPAAKEHILNGPGQTIPGYKSGGAVKKPDQAFIKTANGGTVTRMPNLDEMRYELMMRRK
jgi:hypothetical protein